MKNDKNKQKLQKLIESLVAEELSRLNEGSALFDHPFIGGFIEPFTDIFRVAKAELAKVTATVFENTKKLAKQTVYFAIPFIGAAAIKKAEEEAKQAIEQRIASINEEHRDVYERVYTALKNPDVLGFTFLLDPVLPLSENFALAVKLVKDAPGPLLGALEALTGGHPKVVELRKRYQKATEIPTFGADMYGGGGYGGGYGAGMGDIGFGFGFGDGGGDGGGGGEAVQYDNKSTLSEQQQQLSAKQQQQARFKRRQPKQDPAKVLAAQIQKLLKDPSVQKSIQKSPIVKQFQAAGVDAVVNSIKPVMNAQSYEELKKVVPDFNKIEAEIDKKLPDEEATPEQLEQYKQDFVVEFKELYKQMFMKQIQEKLSKEAGAGGQKLLNQILQQIKSL